MLAAHPPDAFADPAGEAIRDRVLPLLAPSEVPLAYSRLISIDGLGRPWRGGRPHAAVRGLGCLLDAVSGGHPSFLHGRVVSGAPGSLAMRVATAMGRYLTGLLVTDRRVLVVGEQELTPRAILASLGRHCTDPVPLLVEASRADVRRAQRRRWFLNGSRLRLDFADGSWLVANAAAFPGGRRAANRIVAALGS